MKAIVAVENFEDLRVRKLARARKLDQQKAIPAERRITFESPAEMLSCMTPQRIRLWEAAREQPRSMSELATALHRDRKAVHRDIQALHSAGLLILRKQANPGHGQMQVVEAVAQNVELRVRL